MKTVLNLSPVPEAPVGLLDYVDYVAVNEVESAQIIGIDRWDQIPLDDLIQRVYEKLGCDCVLITLGANGCAGKKGDYRREYTSEQSFCKSVEQYIRFYNEVRPHQTLKYQTPQAFEEKYYASFIENPCSNNVTE